MPDGQIAVEMTIQEAKAVTSLFNVVKKQKEMEDGFKGISREEKAAAKEASQFADQIKRVNATPVERYEEAMRRAGIALKAGKVTQQEYNAELTRQKKLLEEAGNASKRATDSLGAGAMLQSWVGFGAVIAEVTTKFSHLKELNDQAIDSMQKTRNINREIVQITGSPEEAAAMMSRADRAAIAYGMTPEDARRLLVDANQKGFEEKFEYIAQGVGVFDPTEAAGVAGKLKGIYANEGMTTEQAINLGLAGSSASDMSFGQMASPLIKAASGAKLAGGKSTEVTAMMSILSNNLGSPEDAAVLVENFASKLSQHQEKFAGKSFIEAARMMSGNDELKEDVLGYDIQANKAQVMLLQYQEDILKAQELNRQAVTNASSEKSIYSQAIARALVVGDSDPLAKNEGSKTRRELVVKEIFGEGAISGDTATREAVTDLIARRTISVGSRNIAEQAGNAAAYSGAGEGAGTVARTTGAASEALYSGGRASVFGPVGVIASPFVAIYTFAKEMSKNTEELKRVNEKLDMQTEVMKGRGTAPSPNQTRMQSQMPNK